MQSTKRKLRRGKTLKASQPPPMLVSPFVADPLSMRLNIVEILTFMSDYRQAYHMCHDVVQDIRTADKNKLLNLEPKETVRFISITLYLLQKLKMYQYMIDLHESFVCNSDIMKRCNPFSLYYIIKYN